MTIKSCDVHKLLSILKHLFQVRNVIPTPEIWIEKRLGIVKTQFYIVEMVDTCVLITAQCGVFDSPTFHAAFGGISRRAAHSW